MTTHTTTLADFLLARIAEDEAVAKAVAAGLHAEIPSEMHWEAYPLPDAGPNRWTMTGVGVKGDEMGHRTEAMFQPDAQHIARHDPARVLAECEAKRQIVGMGGSSCGAVDEPDGWREQYRERFGAEPASHYPVGYAAGCDGCSAAESADRDHQRVMRALALPYDDHPDYDDAWRP